MLFTEDDIAVARWNIQRYPWAREELDFVLEQCRPWVAMSDEAIWDLVPGQQVPRGSHVNAVLGCPSCGREIYRHGLFPWIMSLDRPWKIQCPACGEVYPKNDFKAYHESGRGAAGLFDRSQADAGLLYNTEHPDPADPLHRYGVDDGLGWIDGNGDRWWFVACYTLWGIWNELPSAAHALGLAYFYTGDSAYAHKGILLLDRIADVYPDMDLAPYSALGLRNSHGGRGTGRIKGCISENGVAEGLSQAYGMLCPGMEDDPELLSFLSAQAARWGQPISKRSMQDVRRLIQTNLLREFIRSCKDRRIRGNAGMTHAAMATAAAVLNDPQETPAALEWLFQPGNSEAGGGHLPAILTGRVDRHGIGDESSPGYCFLWMNALRRCARVLERCSRYGDYDLHRHYPRLVRMYGAPYRLTVLARYTLHPGDMGKTGDPGMHSVNLPLALEGMRRSTDPYFARLAHKLNGAQADELRLEAPMSRVGTGKAVRKYYFVAVGLHSPVFEKDLDDLLLRMRETVGDAPPLELDSENLNGYGAVIFRSGRKHRRRAAWLYYGRNLGHGHRDRLNFGLYYRGMDISPDHGNPEIKSQQWPSRAGWTNNTLAHNTVMVNARQQEESWTGHCLLWATSRGTGVAEVASPDVYPGIQEYRRTLAVIDLSANESYAVDFFRVDGGEDHLLSFHGAGGEAAVSGLTPAPQQRGTYAGEQIEYGRHFDGPPDGSYRASGFAYLYDVSRARDAAPGWYADWQIQDTWGTQIATEPVRLRYHALSQADEVALASGQPPQNQVGNPRCLRYLLQRRWPADGRSLFVSVIEPHSGDTPNLDAVERIDLGIPADDLTAAAVRITAADGRTDTVFSSLDGSCCFDLGQDLRVAARFAVISMRGGQLASVFLLGGEQVETSQGRLEACPPAYRGTVLDFATAEGGRCCVDVSGDLPAGTQLQGAQVRFHNDGVQDACYPVQSVEPANGGRLRLDLGDTTLVRGPVDPEDYDKGLAYNIKTGQTFDIQTSVRVEMVDAQLQTVRATAPFRWHPA